MAANSNTLGVLHEQVATALSEQVVGYVDEQVDKEGNKVEINVRPSPALLGAAIAFLKNNNITADPVKNEALANLKQTLADKRKKKISPAELDEAAAAFTQATGGMLQ